MASTKDPPCPACGHESWQPLLERLGVSLSGDLQFIALHLQGRWKKNAGDKRTRTALRVIEMVWIALSREDQDTLNRLDRIASEYRKKAGKQKNGEYVARLNHDGIGFDNPAAIRELVAQAEKLLQDSKMDDRWVGHFLAHAVRDKFPYLLNGGVAKEFQALKASISRDAKQIKGDGSQPMDSDARLLAQHALVSAGVGSIDAHNMFSFLRKAESRTNAKRRAAKALRRKAKVQKKAPRGSGSVAS